MFRSNPVQAALQLALPCALVLAGGCVRVPPAPIDLPARALARTTDSFDLPAIEARAAALAPGEPRPAATGMDRLALFAAILAIDPRVTAARDAVEAARRDALLAHKAASPMLGLAGSYTNDQSQPSPWLIGATADVQLDFGGRKAGRIRAADLGVVSAGYDLVETVWSERIAAARGLVDVLAGQRQVVLGDELLGLYDQQLAAMQRRVDAGELTSLALAPVRAMRAAAARARGDAVARIAGGRAAVATVLGVPAAVFDRVALIWPDFASLPPAPPLPPPPPPPLITVDLRRAALVRRADVLKTMVAYDQSEAALRVELARQMPQINLGPGFTWQGGLITLPFALNLQSPSFDLNRSAIMAAAAHRTVAAQAVEAALADAQGAIEAAASERDAAAAALVRLTREELPQTRRVADRADAQVRLGSIDRADWAAAKAADAAARLAAVDALTRLRLAQIGLEAALRQPLDGPEARITVRSDAALGSENAR